MVEWILVKITETISYCELTIGSISAFFQLPLDLPAMFVIWSIVKEFAAVWKQQKQEYETVTKS